jgi:hypothetical protein
MNKKLIKRVVKQINPDIRVVFNEADNESDIKRKTVFYNFGADWIDQDMQDNLREVHRYFPISGSVKPETFIVLHEVGHIESLKHYTTASVGFALKRYARHIDALMDNETLPYYLKARRYTLLALERKANKWATDFIKNNPDIVQELEKAFA